MAEAPRAAVIVRNPANHDARVLRCARTLQSLGYETVVLAVVSGEEPTRRAVAQGVPILRLAPRAPLAGLVAALRRKAGRRPAVAQPGSVATRLDGVASSPTTTPPGPATRAYRFLRTLSYYRQGIAAVRRLRPDLVHCNDYNTMWIGVGAKLLAGSALVYDSHELWADRNQRSEPRWWLLACEALFLRIADGTLATSPGHAEEIARRHRVAPPRVVRNVAERPGADEALARPAAGTERTLVYCGAVTANRGLEQAIAALPQAPGVALRVLGPGSAPYREHLTGHALRHGVGDRVRIEAAVPPECVVEEIAGADAGLALIQPACRSYALCLPNKLFEYLAAGLPVLAADIPTLGAFVERHGVGILAPPDDTGAIASAMLAIVDPDRNRDLRAAVAGTATSLTWEREAERLEDAYREALGAGRQAVGSGR